MQTPLHFAAHHGLTDLARVLLDKGANPNAIDSQMQTPLHWAAGARVTARALTDNEVWTARSTYDMLPPLYYDHNGDRAKVAQLLLERGADPNVKDIDQRTPARWAEKKLNPDLALLLKNQADSLGKQPSIMKHLITPQAAATKNQHGHTDRLAKRSSSDEPQVG